MFLFIVDVFDILSVGQLLPKEKVASVATTCTAWAVCQPITPGQVFVC